MYVVVVDLLREVGRSNRTSIQIKSNKGQCALMRLAVRTNKLALSKAHIGLECQRRRGARARVGTGAAAANVRQTYDPIEVSDLRGVADIG